MQKIRFLSLTEVCRFHEDQLSRFGGLHGIRSQEILKAATLEPQMTFDGTYLYQDLFEMATCYLFGIIKNTRVRSKAYGLILLIYGKACIKQAMSRQTAFLAKARI